MSCYTWHLEEFLPPAHTSEDTRTLDAAARVYLEMPEADCPEVWVAMREND